MLGCSHSEERIVDAAQETAANADSDNTYMRNDIIKSKMRNADISIYFGQRPAPLKAGVHLSTSTPQPLHALLGVCLCLLTEKQAHAREY